MEPKNESHENEDSQNRIRQRVEKCEKTGHATRYKSRMEKAKAANNGNAQAKKNMKLEHKKKQVKDLQSLRSKHHDFWLQHVGNGQGDG